MAKATKLFLGTSYNPNHTESLALSEHGSWWRRVTSEAGKVIERWGRARPPGRPTHKAKYEPQGGRWMCVGSEPLTKAERARLDPDSVQGNINPLSPCGSAELLKSTRLPMTKEERETIAIANAAKKPKTPPPDRKARWNKSGGPM